MLEETIKIHDTKQFEIKFTYPFDTESPQKSYSIETYLFVPNSLGINKNTYSQNDFYHDMQNYIRLKTPVILLNHIAHGATSPLEALKASIDKLASRPGMEVNQVDFEYKLKMFCSIFRSALRDNELFIENLDKSKELDHAISTFLNNTKEIIKGFRSLRQLIHVPTVDIKNYTIYQLADEYLSLALDKYRYHLFFFLNRSSFKNSEKYKTELIKRLNDELEYRKKNGYPSIPDQQSENETIIYRQSVLKKFMGSILYLNTRTSQEGRVLEQIIFGIGAGTAMAFATSIAFASRTAFGEFTLALFSVLIIAYIFKDRIKELSRNYLNKKIQQLLYDHRTVIYNDLKQKIGICREDVDFISSKKLPQEIYKIRNQDFISQLDNGVIGEKVILYKKHITILTATSKQIFKDFNINGINDITRFNISKFLKKMDNPEKSLFMPTKTDIIPIRGSRTYHLNMVMRYSIKDKPDIFKRFCVILNQNGIKRIEEIKTEPY